VENTISQHGPQHSSDGWDAELPLRIPRTVYNNSRNAIVASQAQALNSMSSANASKKAPPPKIDRLLPSLSYMNLPLPDHNTAYQSQSSHLTQQPQRQYPSRHSASNANIFSNHTNDNRSYSNSYSSNINTQFKSFPTDHSLSLTTGLVMNRVMDINKRSSNNLNSPGASQNSRFGPFSVSTPQARHATRPFAETPHTSSTGDIAMSHSFIRSRVNPPQNYRKSPDDEALEMGMLLSSQQVTLLLYYTT